MAKTTKRERWYKDARIAYSVLGAIAIAFTLYFTLRNESRARDERTREEIIHETFRGVNIDTAIAVSQRFKVMEPDYNYMVSSYRRRHPDLYDTSNH